MTRKECYGILGVTATTNIEEIKKQYRRKCSEYHPDNLKTGNTDKFKEVGDAYKVLMSGKTTTVTTQNNKPNYTNRYLKHISLFNFTTAKEI